MKYIQFHHPVASATTSFPPKSTIHHAETSRHVLVTWAPARQGPCTEKLQSPFYNSWKGCRWTNLLDVVWRSVNSHVRFYSWGLCLAGSWRHVARTPPLANDKRLCVCCAFSRSPHTFFSSATVPHCSTSVLLCKNVFPSPLQASQLERFVRQQNTLTERDSSCQNTGAGLHERIHAAMTCQLSSLTPSFQINDWK